MAISDTQKVDFLFKKLGYGVAKTDINANKAASNESIASSLLIRGDNVWAQASSIPAVKPSATSSIVRIYDDSGNGTATVECTEDITASDNRTWKTNLTDWIPTEFGSTYQVKLYIDDASEAAPQSTGSQIFASGSGNNDEWFFDYQAGVVHFIGTNLPSAITTGVTDKRIYVVGARYIGAKGVAGTSDLTFTNTTIATSTSNANIILDPNGTGNVTIDTTTGLVIPTGTTAQRPGSPGAGTLRFNSSTGRVEVYDGSAWEAVGGTSISVTSQTIDGDGSTTGFTLTQSATAGSIIVSINGVVQVPDSGYTVSGTSLTMAEAPASGDKLEIRFIASNTSVISAVSDASGNTTVEANNSIITLAVASSTIAEITTNEIFNISNAHSLQLPVYTVTQANALSNKTAGQIIYVSNGDGGSPSLAVYNNSDWKVVALGSTISAS